MKQIFKSISVLGLGMLLLAGCKDKEAELLVPKLYFETLNNSLKVEKTSTLEVELQSRLSSKNTSDVNVSYTIGDESLVKAYNARFGKEYKLFNPENVSLSEPNSKIAAGSIYADKVALQFNNLDAMAEGETFLLPICVNTSSDVAMISGSEITYFILNKPLEIKKVGRFSSSYITLDLSPLDVFSEVTYEAVVCVDRFYDNNTVMGCEGIMIMRIGDAGGGTVPRDILQIAGKGEITWTGNPLSAKKWYHLAFTCGSDNKAKLYVNGEPVIEAGFPMSADLTANNADFGFSIGQVPNFMWGSRPFNGYMTQVRLWDVVRTPEQIKENMLSVDPKSPGLIAYFKLDGAVVNAAEGGRPAKKTWGVS